MKRRYLSSFREEWLLDENYKEWLQKVDSDECMCKCRICSVSFTVKYDGVKAVNKHLQSERHKANIITQKKNQSLLKFLPKQFSAEDDKITATELTLTYHGVKHHHSYNSQDCSNKLYPHVFRDSSVATKVRCGRTKSEALVKNVLLPYAKQRLLSELKDSVPFSLGSDASNKGNKKHYPIVLTYFSKDKGKCNEVLDFYEDVNESAEAISNKLKSILLENGLCLNNVVSYSADNASVNFGKHNSVFTRLKEGNSNLIKANCCCHILHNCAKFGFKLLKYDVESLVLKIYSDFSSSSKNSEELKTFCEFAQHDYSEILRHIVVRWLSLQSAVERLVKMWRVLKMYYVARGEEKTHPLIWKFITSQQDEINEYSLSLPECFLYFLNATLPVFSNAIRLLEKEDTLSTDVHGIMLEVKKQIEGRKEDNFYGFEVNMSLEHLTEEEKNILIKECTLVYDRLLNYLNKWYNFSGNDNVYNIVSVLDLCQSKLFSFNDLVEVGKKLKISFDGNELYNEFSLLKSVVTNHDRKDSNCCKVWSEFFEKADAPNLFKIMQHVLAVPVSNAHVERVFSVMNALWSDARNRMTTELVKAEICVQMNLKMKCEDFYSVALQDKTLLNAARSSKKYEQ